MKGYALGWIAASSLLLLGASPPPLAGMANGDPEAAVRQADAAFWQAYNACGLTTIGDFFSEDIEFYHDKGGLTKSRPAMVASLRKGICNDPSRRIRREAYGTAAYHPMAGHRALLSGEHRFYTREPGQPEHLDGQAKFDELWELSDGRWRMSRVFSYDHGPAS